MLEKRYFSALIGLLICAIVLISACGPKKGTEQADSEQEKGMPVVVTQLALKNVDLKITATGVIRSKFDVPLMSEVAGTVLQKVREIGDPVKPGEAIVLLDPEPYELAFAQVEGSYNATSAAYDQALRDYERYVELAETEDVSDYELETAKLAERTAAANLQMAEAAIKLAERNLRLTQLSSPVAGSVADLDVIIGQQVMPGALLGKVVANDKLEVEVGLSEREIIDVRKGNSAEVNTSVYPGKTFNGKVTAVGTAGLDMGRSFPVIIELENTDRLLKPGMITVVKIIYKRRENVIAINRDALVLSQDTPTVFVVENGIALQRQIRLGRSSDDQVVVEEGLAPGEVLVTTGQNVLKDSTKVKIL